MHSDDFRLTAKTWQTPWVVILGGCLISLIGFGARSSYGLYLGPITQELGWTRETFAFAMALQNLFWGMMLPLSGMLADRIGPLWVIGVGALIYAFGTVDSWLVWKLTGGVHITDTTNASRTLLFDIREMRWSDEMCDLLNVPMSALPEVRPSSGRFGVTTDNLPIPSGIPVSGIAGDQQAALFGQACFEPGQAKNTYGTGSFVLMNVGPVCPEPVEGLLTTVAWTLDEGGEWKTTYAYEGAIFVTGAAVQWLRDGLGIITSSADIGPLAETVDDAGGVVIVPAFTGLGSPWWDPYARGTVLGITRGTTRAHLARAVVDSMALQTRDAVEAMVAASGVALAELRVDGGASVMNLLLRLQADQLGISVRRPTDQETTSLGAAFLAGLAEGIWPDLGSIEARWSTDVLVEPHPSESIERALADAQYDTWKRAVERSLRWAHDGD
ncbi:MAG: hypothetical protein EBY47_09975 [Actinobacteria bacterium]|nr:hypothetical protein [Actinomycetota bacterium]